MSDFPAAFDGALRDALPRLLLAMLNVEAREGRRDAFVGALGLIAAMRALAAAP